MKPYVSIDLETTGLDTDQDQIIEFGAVIDDWVSPIDQLPRLHGYVKHPRLSGDAYALAMNSEILWKLAKPEEGVTYFSPHMLMPCFGNWIANLGLDPEKITAAGKNFASFDLQLLKRLPNDFGVRFKHRCIDPAMYYMLPGEEPPNTLECMKRAGIEGEVAHTAIADAIVVIKLIRKHFGIAF